MGTRLLEEGVQLPIELTDETGASFTVRPFGLADRTALERMYDAFEPKRAAQGLPPRSPPEVRRWLDRVLASGQHLVVEVEGRLLGHVMLIPMEGDAVELANFLHQSVATADHRVRTPSTEPTGTEGANPDLRSRCRRSSCGHAARSACSPFPC